MSHPRSVSGSAQRRGRRQSSARRVYDLVRASIRRGDVGGSGVLVEERLIEELSASRQAVRDALQALAADGLVERRRRVGTTVNGAILDVATDQLMHLPPDQQVVEDSAVERLEEQEMPAPPWMRARLKIAEDEPVLMVEELVRAHGEVLCVRATYKPVSRLPARATVRVADLATAFEHGFGVPLGSVESLVEAVGADALTAELLGVPAGSPVLVREVLLVDADGLPRDLSYSHYRSDRICFTHTTEPRTSSVPVPGVTDVS
ncbi:MULTISPECIES: GntR family transcriptional regulator [unclassified Nocardioides]|uniref:GntR family transcriptional regulator n=1 Tax=unclassified Nocardioides TaxID=2615069 RepID=UPI003014EDAB